MKKVNRFFYIIFLLLSLSVSAQHKYLDFIVNFKNDTIYGTFRSDAINGKVLFEKNPYPKKGGVKFYNHKLKKIKLLRCNDELFTYDKPDQEDGIYAETKVESKTNDKITSRINDFVNSKPKLIDYVVTKTNDTIYGEIKNRGFGILLYFDQSKNKIFIKEENIKSYRYLNNVYTFLEKPKVDILDKKIAPLKCLINGKVKLFEYERFSINSNNNVITNQSKLYYYILKNNELLLLSELSYKKDLSQLFADNDLLVSKINNDEYSLDNIYLIVKFYNRI